MADVNHPKAALAYLRTPEAVRERSRAILDLAGEGRLAHFGVDMQKLGPTADYVAAVILENYPSLEVPYHARWRHFAAGGRDRWADAAKLLPADRAGIARSRIDLAVVSVLLDAGAGGLWSYRDSEGTVLSRSEGLGVASLEGFCAGLFSSDPKRPLQADAAALQRLEAAEIMRQFQAGPGNPLLGAEGRAALMRNLGAVLAARPDLFGDAPARPGNLFDRLAGDSVSASAILAALLDGLAPIWPSRLTIAGENLGDVWRHGALENGDTASGFVPFHKLSQWMTYSLIEVFEDAGVPVTGIDRLTGLPEYRNGGLLIDSGLLTLKDDTLGMRLLPVDHVAVVEWRALTVALLDRLADPVRQRLGRPDMPLACILEGGTWSAGRKIAAEKRAGGVPPLTILSDGTVF